MWKCDVTGSKVRGSIKVDGSDRCDCIACRRYAKLQGAIGTIDATRETLNDTLQYMTNWNDPAEALRLCALVRDRVSELQHTLRQVTGDRPLCDEYVRNPDDIATDRAAGIVN